MRSNHQIQRCQRHTSVGNIIEGVTVLLTLRAVGLAHVIGRHLRQGVEREKTIPGIWPAGQALCRFVWNATASADDRSRAERVSWQVL